MLAGKTFAKELITRASYIFSAFLMIYLQVDFGPFPGCWQILSSVRIYDHEKRTVILLALRSVSVLHKHLHFR
jgi:hypothetical protein